MSENQYEEAARQRKATKLAAAALARYGDAQTALDGLTDAAPAVWQALTLLATVNPPSSETRERVLAMLRTGARVQAAVRSAQDAALST